MKIILSSAIALALTAFGARAQTTTNDNSATTANPAAPSTTPPTGEDKGTAGIKGSDQGKTGDTTTLPSTSTNSGAINAPADTSATGSATTGAPGDTSNSGDVSAKTNGSGSSISGNTSTDESNSVTIKKHHKKHHVRNPEGRSEKSESSSMHHDTGSSTALPPSDTSTSGSLKGDTSKSGSDVQRPAAPSATKPDTATSKPGDVTGQPTDTQKPVDTTNPTPPNDQPDKK